MLFDPTKVEGQPYRKHTEPLFHFLERSPHAGFARVRRILEDWSQRFPKDADWLRRIRSRDDAEHLSAFFELYCHELMTRQGFQLERPLSSRPSHLTPDYLVTRDGVRLCYLEATVYFGPQEELTNSKHLDRLRDAINALDLGGVRVSLSVRQRGTQSIRTRHVCSAIAARASASPHDSALDDELVIRDRDWELEFHLLSLAEDEDSTLAVEFGDARWVQSAEPLHKRMREKARKYKGLDIPLVIAIDCLDEVADEAELVAALFGQSEGASLGRSGGLWCDRGYHNNHVSGAILVNRLVPWTVQIEEPLLWQHPNDKAGLDRWGWHLPLRGIAGVGDQYWVRDGRSAKSVLGLSDDLLRV